MRVNSLLAELDKCSPNLELDLVDSETFESLGYKIVGVESVATKSGESHVIVACVSSNRLKDRI